MSLLDIIGTILLGPLKLVFEVIFSVACNVVNTPGAAIIVLSLVMNTLLLPLYRRADAVQIEARDTEARLKETVDHIKKTFSGDERMMILQTYYQQNNYSPLSALNGSVSLLLEIPFFMAAYQFLSGLELLRGVAFGPIADLSVPDGLIVIGSLTVNLLPFLMTLINVVSSTLYLKGFPLKTKIQLYGMALLFLVVLYDSPSGLVFYWTLNNTFSLLKTLYYRIPHSQKLLTALLSAAGAMFIFRSNQWGGQDYKTLLIVLGIVMELPWLLPLLKRLFPKENSQTETACPNAGLFACGGLFLTVLVGLLIPSTFIAASPQEYIDIFYFYNPVLYILRSVCMAAGLFLVWMGVFYWLANDSGKVLMSRIIWVLCGIMLMNYMFFGTNLGIITPNLQYEQGMQFASVEMLSNICALVLVSLVLWFLYSAFSKNLYLVLLTGVIALGGMSGLNISKIIEPVQKAGSYASAENPPEFGLSTTGKNVVVITLDRGMGQYVPYLMNERPELQNQFAGFTYYENTISLGGSTIFGAPAMMGGYEYSPVEMNKRDTEQMVDKHNEALKVMPVLFDQNGFDVTVCDSPYANYQEIPDLSIYDEYPDIKAYLTQGRFDDTEQKQMLIDNRKRNFFCFSLMKTMPLFLQEGLYNNGQYHQTTVYTAYEKPVAITQTVTDTSTAEGIDSTFMSWYNVLLKLPEMTKVKTEPTNTFLYLYNKTPHAPALLQEPDYTPAAVIDNKEYDQEHKSRFTVDGTELQFWNAVQMSHYHVNMATMIQLGNWFDYLREQNVFDNTRIIIVADHGFILNHNSDISIDPTDWMTDVARFYPLLMVKDYGSKEYTTSQEFMTNADVVTIAVSGLFENPVNPFTGKIISNDEKYAHDQYVIMSHDWQPELQSGNTFVASDWAAVKDNMKDMSNWTIYKGHYTLKEHAAP